MKIHRTEHGVHISVDTRENGSLDELVGLRFMLNAYGPFVRHVDQMDRLIKEYNEETKDK